MLEIILGWEKLTNYPTEKAVIVFSHTSYWDLIVWIMYFKPNLFILINPNYYNWLTKWIYDILNFIPSSYLEKRNGGLVGKLVTRFKNRSESIFLSPKGTIKKKSWRTGYYHLARGLGVKIYPLVIDYEKRQIWFGEPCDPSNSPEPDCKEFLVTQFQHGVEFNLNNVEYSRQTVSQYPYARLFPFDFCLVCLLGFLPTIFILLFNHYYLVGGVSCTAFGSSFVYHYYHEGNKKNIYWIRLIEIWAVYASFILVLVNALPYYKTLSYSCYLTLLLGYFFLRCGYGRTSLTTRGLYYIYHSFFHILGSLGTLQLTESFVYGNP